MLRKQARRMFKFDDEIFLKAFHASPDSIIIARASDGQILEVNEGFTRTMGYTRDDALGSSTIALGVWANPQDRIDCMNTLRAKRSLREREYDFRTKSGRILNCLYSGEVLELDGEICAISIVRDVTERKQSETALRDSEERYRTLFDNILDGVYRSTHDGRFVDVNPAMIKIFGYNSKDEMLKVHIKKELYFSEQDRQSLFLDTGQEKIETFRMRHRNGSEIWVEDHGRYVHDADGNVIFHEGILRDVTERVQVEEIMQLRLRLNEYAASHSLTALIQKALDEIGLITNSPISFYHTVEPDQKTISLQGWSTRTLEEFCQTKGVGMYYNIDEAGVWVDCVHQRKPVIHNDYASLPHRKGLPAGHAEVIRELVVPILRQGLIVSILGVGNKPADYNEQDVELVVYIADAVWEILERKRAEEALRRQNGYLAALQETTLDLLSQFELDTLLENIVRRAAILMGTSSGYIDLVDSETGQLKPRVGLGALAESLDHVAEPGEGVAGIVWQTGKPLVVENYDVWFGRIEKFSLNTVRSVIGVPLLSGAKIVGVLGLAYDAASKKAFKQEDVEPLTQFARLATIAIENARLFSAFQKELTERKRAEEGLRQLSRAVEQSPVSIVITDTTGQIVYDSTAITRFSKMTHNFLPLQHHFLAFLWKLRIFSVLLGYFLPTFT